MCIGVPMQVIESSALSALCEADGKQERIDMMLVGEQAPGTWILNFLGAAREVMTAEHAANVRQALTAMSDIMQGKNEVEHLFADLIAREPELPPHLQSQLHTKPTSKE